MNRRVLKLTKKAKASSTEKLILLFMVDCLENKVPCTIGEIEYLLGLEDETVNKAINHLISIDLLKEDNNSIELNFDL